MSLGWLLRAGIAANVLLFSSMAQADQGTSEVILHTFRFGSLEPNQPYITPLTTVAGGAVFVERIDIAIFGRYCRFISGDFEYFTSAQQSRLKIARMTEPGKFDVDDDVYSFRYKFEQTRYSNVDCELQVRATVRGGSTGEENWKNLEFDASSLSTSASLLSSALNLAEGYSELRGSMATIIEVVLELRDGVMAREEASRLRFQLKLVQTATRQFEEQFLPIHLRLKDREVEDAWVLFGEALARVEKAIEGQ